MHFLFSIIGLNMYDEFIFTLYEIIHVLRSLTIQLEAHPDEQTQKKCDVTTGSLWSCGTWILPRNSHVTLGTVLPSRSCSFPICKLF